MRKLARWFMQRRLGVGLWALFVLSLFLMLKSSSDQLPGRLRRSGLQWALSQFPSGNQVIFDLTSGIIVSLLIYVLVVKVPERTKRKHVKRNLQRQYDSFKRACIYEFLWCLGGGANVDLVEQLKDRERFRTFFQERVSPSQERWHVVLNNLDEHKIKRLIVELEILRDEVNYALNTIDIDDPEAFAFLKRLAEILYRNRSWTPEYDDVKELSGFMWSVHTGWSIMEGYTGRDIIGDMIKVL